MYTSLNESGLIFRYIGAGLWNTLFGWLCFALVWFFGNAWMPLWGVAVVAHFLATTQAFWVQRNWVFQSKNNKISNQYFRFQLVYLGLLGGGVFMLQALSSQGVPPLIAQVLVMLAQAGSGLFLGRSFTFNVLDVSLRRPISQIFFNARENVSAWLIFSLSLFIFYKKLSLPFYSSLDYQGHDFSLAATALLEGKFWFQSNGIIPGLFNPPWFTPAWCAGAAFFADPQASFYSPVQWLSIELDPFQATQIATLLFAAVAYWGGYLLSRKVFMWGMPAAIIFSVLGMANAFMPMRSAVGETGYQPLYLWTLLALAMCWSSQAYVSWRSQVLPVIAVALVLTAWLQFGFAGMMVPAFLAVLLLCFTLVLQGLVRLQVLLLRAGLGGFLAILLNGSKLYEAASLMRNFPRDFYGMPGFPSLYDALVASVMALIFPSEWTADFGMRRLEGMQFTVYPHEWALEFGWGAFVLAILVCLAYFYLREKSRRITPIEPGRASMWNGLLWCGVGVLLALPSLLMWNHGVVRDALKEIPILNSAAWPMRWIVIYIPLVQWLLALPVQKLLLVVAERFHVVLVTLMSVLVWLGPVTAPIGYYKDPGIQAYDPKPIITAFQQTQRSGKPIPIESIVVNPRMGISRNDAMLYGFSQGACYNPLYGYRLESFPQADRLKSGPALMLDERGQSLLYNPACLVHPEANACKPGDGFLLARQDQRQAADLFLARKPFEWKRPLLGVFLSHLSQVVFWLLVTILCLIGWRGVLQACSSK